MHEENGNLRTGMADDKKNRDMNGKRDGKHPEHEGKLQERKGFYQPCMVTMGIVFHWV